FLHAHPPTPHLHSFPTRRSSDLSPRVAHPQPSGTAWPPPPSRRGATTARSRRSITPIRATCPRTSRSSSASPAPPSTTRRSGSRSEEHTSELQSQSNLVCRLLLE